MSSRITKTLATVSATGIPAGLQVDFGDAECFTMFALSYAVVSGTVATMSMQIEATVNGTDWFVIGSPITGLTGGLTIPSTSEYPFKSVRANVTVLTGTSPILNVTLGAGRYFQG